MRVVEWMPPLFRDRADGGRALAEALSGVGFERPVVVGVARGGVAVAFEVARALDAPLTAVDVERVNARGLRLGAATAEGPPYLLDHPTVSERELEAALEHAQRSAAALDARLGLASPALAGRTALVIDDGAISGLTLAAACRWARGHAPRLVAATPVGRADGLARVRAEADAVVCPHELEQIAVVGQAYDGFEPLDEWYVASLLADAAGG